MAVTAVTMAASGAPKVSAPAWDFLDRLRQADQVTVCVFRDGIPSMERSGFDPKLLRHFRAHGCVPLESDLRAQLENMLHDPRSWNSPVLPPSDRPDPVHTRFAFRFTRASQKEEIRYVPETGRLEGWSQGRMVAQGYCGEQGEWMNLVQRSFPSDREILSLLPGYKIDPKAQRDPCEGHTPNPPLQAQLPPRKPSAGTTPIFVETILDLPNGWDLPPGVDPWSPDGRYLALNYNDESRCNNGLFVFDMTHASQPPKSVGGGPSDWYAWSPDGKWLAWALWGYNHWGTLMVSSADGKATFGLVQAMQFGPFLWTRDERIIFWERPEGSLPNSYPPLPRTTKDRGRIPLSRLAWGNVRTSGRPQHGVSPKSSAALDARQATLASLYERTGTQYQVLEDREGKRISLLGASGVRSGHSPGFAEEDDRITWTSGSSDGASVVGYQLAVAIDEVTGSELYVADLRSMQPGDSIVSGIPLGVGDGTWPRFSPRDRLVVWAGAGVHVVKLNQK